MMSVVKRLKPPNWDVGTTISSTLFVETEIRNDEVISEASKVIKKDSSNVWALFVYSRHKKKVQWECPLCSDPLHFGKTKFLLSLKLRVLRHLGACHGIVHYNFEEHLYAEWMFLQDEFGTKIDIFQNVPKSVKQVEKHRSSINFITHLDDPGLVEIFGGANAFCEICCEGVSSLDHLRKHGESVNKLSFSEFFQCDELSIDEYPFPHPLLVYGCEETCSEQQTTSACTAAYTWHCRVPSCWNNISFYFPTTVILKAHALRHFEEFHKGLFNEVLLDNEWSILHAEAGLIGIDLRRQGQAITADVTCPDEFVHSSTRHLIPFEYRGHRICQFCFFTNSDEKKFRRHLRRHGYREEEQSFLLPGSLKQGRRAVRELSIDFRKHLCRVRHMYGDKQVFRDHKEEWMEMKGDQRERMEKEEENEGNKVEEEYTKNQKKKHQHNECTVKETSREQREEEEEGNTDNMETDEQQPKSKSNFVSTVSDDESTIEEELISYRKRKEDREFALKTIAHIVRRMPAKGRGLNVLLDAVKFRGRSPTPCVTIRREKFSIRVAGKRGHPHVLCSGIWRWPNVTWKELRQLNCCTTNSDRKTCINPYHYERVPIPDSRKPGSSLSNVLGLQQYQEPSKSLSVVSDVSVASSSHNLSLVQPSSTPNKTQKKSQMRSGSPDKNDQSDTSVTLRALQSKAIDRLLSYRKMGKDIGPEFAKKAIQYLLNRLESAEQLDALLSVLESEGKSSDCCFPVRHYSKGMIKVNGIMISPIVLFSRIWRWPDVIRKELRKLNHCTTNDKQFVCVNPYHYERVSLHEHRKAESQTDPLTVLELLRYQKGDQDPQFVKTSIQYLLEKLEDKDSQVKVLLNVLKSEGKSTQQCVNIREYLNGRIMVAGKGCLPHVLYCRLWRWPDLGEKQLQRSPSCSTPSRGKIACVNPWHYERIDVDDIDNVPHAPEQQRTAKRKLNEEPEANSRRSTLRKKGKWERSMWEDDEESEEAGENTDKQDVAGEESEKKGGSCREEDDTDKRVLEEESGETVEKEGDSAEEEEDTVKQERGESVAGEDRENKEEEGKEIKEEVEVKSEAETEKMSSHSAVVSRLHKRKERGAKREYREVEKELTKKSSGKKERRRRVDNGDD